MNGIKLRSSVFRALILLAVLIFTGVSLSLSSVDAATNIDVHGVVFDSANGGPVEGAEILVYYPRSGRYMSSQWQKYKSAASGSSGEFSLSLEEGRSCLMIVTHKNQYNAYDFVPYGLRYTPSQDPDNVSIKQSCYGVCAVNIESNRFQTPQLFAPNKSNEVSMLVFI